MKPERHSQVLDLRTISGALALALEPLTTPAGRFRTLLRTRPEAVILLALDETGPLGWAVVEADGLAGVFVAPRRRRRGIAARLVEELVPEARRRWPNVEIHALTRPGSPGAAFWRRMGLVLTGLRRAG